MSSEKKNIRTRPNPTCLLCGSPGRLLYSGLKDRLFSAPGEWQLKQCTRAECGLIWPDPVAIPEDLHLAYQKYYTHTEPTGAVARLKQQVLSRGYRFAIGIPAVLTGLMRQRRDFMHMYLDELKPGKLFDAGCGDGQFLHLMSQFGWQGTGIDFDEAAIETGRQKYGLTLAVGDFQTATIEENAFDAVTMSHVIEHVPDPIGCLAKCRRMLKPGGRLVVTTPNTRSLGHQEFKESWRGLEPPRHLHIFHPALLGECAQRAGLHVVRTGSTAVNADYIINASLAIRNAPPEATTGVGGGWDVRQAPKAIPFQYREHFALRRNPDLGEEAYVVAERKA
jgi:2-polyprenyl-3-methyl-5-hydroxy-6-metoxy-1,4-benzoquinol methylase